ncbi:cupin family [Chlorella sorokiniana]|jgi:predicted cupin superfamily sugar epimerase|uniref:Cupin family n=1 Tax=Chlorella sorokiniana TaxID=3076 RepID=A0A2P6TUY8_CHLSO|nr:cupin family [Chlorella sorokiniana]|eukprot:PRW57882.1 cupin family [Chlorella sorokiniana]
MAAAELPTEVKELIQRLQLEPHPEGGFYRETFRDAHQVDGRAASTAILYLLPAGAKSKLHRLDASECWHAYLGGPITIVELDPSTQGARTTQLGSDLSAGQQLQHVVPPHTWFGAAPAEGTAWALVGCTVAPGFEFQHFEFGDREQLLQQFPQAAPWVERLMSD